jgi:integrase
MNRRLSAGFGRGLPQAIAGGDAALAEARPRADGTADDCFVFVGVKGGQLRRNNFFRPWARALAKAGLPTGTHVHDLRHAGNTLGAEAGASLPELMSRMGHSSARAAMIYLHA